MRMLGSVLCIAAASWLVACSSDSKTTGGALPKPKSDAAVGDDAGGGGGSDGGGGGMDAGMPDSGPVGPCNPVDGSNCGAQTCFLVALGNMVAPQCRDLAMPTVAAEQQCDPALQNCESGFTCLPLQQGMPPVCLKVCRNGQNADCASQQDGQGNPYSCLLQLSQDYGLCSPTPTACEPYNDMCMQGEHCEVIGVGQLGCIPDGMAMVGQSCSPQNPCARGGICVNLGGGARCEKPCNPMGGAGCGMGETCSGELQTQQGGMTVGLGFGVCGSNSCNPLTVEQDCMMGQNCDFVGTALDCVPAGPQTVGMSCGQAGACARGGVCVNLAGGNGPQCYQPCDGMNPMCPMGTQCNMLQGIDGFGICI